MKTENSILMKQARESLKGRWGLAVGVAAVYLIITIAVQSVDKDAGPVLGFIIAGPLNLGMIIFSLAIARNANPKIDQLFSGFYRFGSAFIAYFLVTLFTILWALLLIIPGIIASLSYAMTLFILADDQSITPREAIRKSKKMMYGYKWKYFLLNLRFIGWAILALLSVGIGFLWLLPYIQVSQAKFYEDIKGGEAIV